MTKHRLAGCFAAVLPWGGVVSAHDGHLHRVMGTITMAAADHVMLKTAQGKDVTMQVTEKTKITKGKAAATIDDLKVGTRVVVTPVSEKEPLLAATIQVATTAKRAAQK